MPRPSDPAWQQAKLAGEKFYHTPCKHGHSLRRTKDRQCVECNRNQNRQRRTALSQQVLAESSELGAPLFRGAACKRGHSGLRYVRNGACVECHKTVNNLLSKKSREQLIEGAPEYLWAKETIKNAKKRAKAENLPFDMSIESTIPLLRTADYCPLLGYKLIYRNPGYRANNSMSLDKMVPSQGYQTGNMRIISNRANIIKQDTSPEELLVVATRNAMGFGMPRENILSLIQQVMDSPDPPNHTWAKFISNGKRGIADA